MAQQLPFDLPVRAALGRDDFFVSPANAMKASAMPGASKGRATCAFAVSTREIRCRSLSSAFQRGLEFMFDMGVLRSKKG